MFSKSTSFMYYFANKSFLKSIIFLIDICLLCVANNGMKDKRNVIIKINNCVIKFLSLKNSLLNESEYFHLRVNLWHNLFLKVRKMNVLTSC